MRTSFWQPNMKVAPVKKNEVDIHARLVRAGYLRQTHSGLFHMLPLGLRVQRKLEALIDKYMVRLGAQRLELSSISSEELWQHSGRLTNVSAELFHLQDRKGQHFVLAPTHEEEITQLVAKGLASYKELPVRLYQITRKYRDEMRPRAGMLRAREFLMKDMYTFDDSVEKALEAYDEVRNAYTGFFRELGVDVIAAQASSGDMGGTLSHEYLLPSLSGEDEVLICRTCGYAANKEVTTRLTNKSVAEVGVTEREEGLVLAKGGDICPGCRTGNIDSVTAIELAHTFYLGTRYSEPFHARVNIASRGMVPLQMGCHGIGVSRVIAAVAEHHLQDQNDSNEAGIFRDIHWPLIIAPFHALVVLKRGVSLDPKLMSLIHDISNTLGLDILLDDRTHAHFSDKIVDARMAGYPITIAFDLDWATEEKIDVECRQIGYREVHYANTVREVIASVIQKMLYE